MSTAEGLAPRSATHSLYDLGQGISTSATLGLLVYKMKWMGYVISKTPSSSQFL